MPQQPGAKRAAKVAVRKRKLEVRRQTANFKRLEREATAVEHDHDHDHDHDHEHEKAGK
jgi:hypothetical protein